MRDFFTALALTLLLLVSAIVLCVITVGLAYAAEPIPDCDYVPTQATPVYYDCKSKINGVAEKLVGKGEVRVWICNEPYTIPIDCSQKVAP